MDALHSGVGRRGRLSPVTVAGCVASAAWMVFCARSAVEMGWAELIYLSPQSAGGLGMMAATPLAVLWAGIAAWTPRPRPAPLPAGLEPLADPRLTGLAATAADVRMRGQTLAAAGEAAARGMAAATATALGELNRLRALSDREPASADEGLAHLEATADHAARALPNAVAGARSSVTRAGWRLEAALGRLGRAETAWDGPLELEKVSTQAMDRNCLRLDEMAATFESGLGGAEASAARLCATFGDAAGRTARQLEHLCDHGSAWTARSAARLLDGGQSLAGALAEGSGALAVSHGTLGQSLRQGTDALAAGSAALDEVSATLFQRTRSVESRLAELMGRVAAETERGVTAFEAMAGRLAGFSDSLAASAERGRQTLGRVSGELTAAAQALDRGAEQAGEREAEAGAETDLQWSRTLPAMAALEEAVIQLRAVAILPLADPGRAQCVDDLAGAVRELAETAGVVGDHVRLAAATLDQQTRHFSDSAVLVVERMGTAGDQFDRLTKALIEASSRAEITHDEGGDRLAELMTAFSRAAAQACASVEDGCGALWRQVEDGLERVADAEARVTAALDGLEPMARQLSATAATSAARLLSEGRTGPWHAPARRHAEAMPGIEEARARLHATAHSAAEACQGLARGAAAWHGTLRSTVQDFAEAARRVNTHMEVSLAFLAGGCGEVEASLAAGLPMVRATSALTRAIAAAPEGEPARLTACAERAAEAAALLDKGAETAAAIVAAALPGFAGQADGIRAGAELCQAHAEAVEARIRALSVDAYVRQAADLASDLRALGIDVEERLFGHGRMAHRTDHQRLVKAILAGLDRHDASIIRHKFEDDPAFRERVSVFLLAMENLLDRLTRGAEGESLLAPTVASDVGRLYVLLSGALGRL